MFPFVRCSHKLWLTHGLLMGSLVVFNPLFPSNERSTTTTTPAEIVYLSEMESHLKSKAGPVIERFTSGDYTVDLNVELVSTHTVTTTYLPGDKILVADQEEHDGSHRVRQQKWELTGTWIESSDARPSIKQLRCCVTLSKPEAGDLDVDHLYRCLSYELGVDLRRGDLLQIVVR